MELCESEDHTFHLDILDYQYPSLVEGRFHDRNWLSVRFKYRCHQQSWSVTEPALLVWEAHDLAFYCVQLAEQHQPSFPVAFSTVDQQFEMVCLGQFGSFLRLEISNYFINPPAWLDIDSGRYAKHVLMVDSAVLLQAGMQLEQALQGFPVRPEVLL